MTLWDLKELFSWQASSKVSPNVLPLQQSQGVATQTQRLQLATNQNPDIQEPASLSPNLEQQQPVTPQQQQQQQQLDLQNNPRFGPSLQHYSWSPPGGSALIIPLQPSIHGPQHANANQLTLPQQPQIFPPYGYLPMFPSPYSNQLFSPYGFPVMFEPPRPQLPASQLPNSPVLPAENTAAAAAAAAVATAGNTVQPQQQQQQQQNTPVVYMLQQPMSNTMGGLSSEELEMAAKMSQLGVYMPSVLTNMPAGASQSQSRVAGLPNPQQQGAAGIMEASAAGVSQTQGLPCSGSQPNANSVPAGLEKAAPEAASVQTPVQAKL
ncbi:ameloblastin isoform X2 [Parambassis ranga]|uniref:Ameloblastin isoform X2 n=1 Tax=Parambassis ranga TaxID=210632 RepID=A0A6P7IEG9_9TELE|nr:putative uncharacterized protein DDB_G0294196 isoform X2 [Parambassis ranga]